MEFKDIYKNWIEPADPKTSFQGKTVIVTGSNTGLGYEATLKFVRLGASKVIMAVRDIGKGEKAKTAIEEEHTGQNGGNVLEVWQLDMASYDSIQAFAARASTELPRLDIAVLNAGVFQVEHVNSTYGWAMDLQVNALSTIYLGLLLLPKLKASALAPATNPSGSGTRDPPVLEFVTSGLHAKIKLPPAHRQAANIMASYNTPHNYDSQEQYAVSKFFLQIGIHGLISSLAGANADPEVVVLAACPNGCKSDLARGYTSFAFKIIYLILGWVYLRSTEAGARSLVSGTTLGPKAHDKWWQNDEVKQPILQYSDTERAQLQEKIWPEIVNALEKDVPNTRQLLKQLAK